jgi:phosphoadenosine phosphosulfate reductase
MIEPYIKTKPDLGQSNMSGINLESLNKKYGELLLEERIKQLYNDFDKILLTSSFGTSAVYQLHLFYKQNIKQPVHFINTTFHFKETLEYKMKLTSLFNLEVIDINPDPEWSQLSHEASLWKIDPDQCCKINKVDPFEAVKKNYTIWISGLMRWQSNHRERLDIFEQRNGIIKFYPILDVTEEEVHNYIKRHKLPIHPLKLHGYESIGCTHCTRKGKKRKGRWSATLKTECGLHL